MGGRSQRVARHRAGLAAFDQPRFLHVDPTGVSVSRATIAEQLRAQSLIGRSALAVVLVAAAPLLHGDDDALSQFAWLVALGWLPVVAAIDLARRRWSVRHLDAVELIWDVALFAGVATVLDAPEAALIGYVLLVGFHAYVGGPRRAVVALLLAGAAAVGLPLTSTTDHDQFGLAVAFAASLLLAWLLADAAHRQDRSRAGLLQVSDRAAAILAGIADAVVVTTPDGRIQEWNPAAARLFEGSQEVPSGARCSQLMRLRSGLRPLSCDDRCALLSAAEEGQEVDIVRIDGHGQRQPLLTSASAVLNGRGDATEVIHSFRDITALKAAEEAKTLFLATASHELKTPLTVIRGFAQMLQRAALPESEREPALQAIERRANQLDGIVDRLLMSSRIDAGRIDLDVRQTVVGGVLRERADAVRAATQRRVVVAIDDDLPEVHVDLDALTTVVDHLLDNAVKYSPEGGSVTLAATHDREQGEVVVTVQDEGIGMSAEQVDHCFERFWQAEASHVRRFGGTGIGLYIVQSLVEAMAAAIDVESTPGSGSTFNVRLRTSPPPAPVVADTDDVVAADEGQPSMIREYMRQVGVPLQRTGGSP